MSQANIPTCGTIKGKEIDADELNRGKMQCNASAISWLSQVKSTFDPQHKIWQVSKNVCIYRVPESMKVSKKEDYIPLVVSLGPYHHKIDPELSRMDQHKLEAMHRMLPRLNIDVITLISEIQKLEGKIRDCYEEAINLDGEALSWMLAMDACFILEFLRGDSDPNCFSLVFQNNFHDNSMTRDIMSDIMKLENQIPLVILTTLLQLEFGTRKDATERLAELLIGTIVFWGSPFYSVSSPSDDDISGHYEHLKDYIEKDACHLLDLYRILITDMLINSSEESDTAYNRQCNWWMNVSLPGWVRRPSCIDILTCPSPTLSPSDSWFTPSAELLQKAGIKFQPGPLGFQKRSFGTGTFSLPQILIEDDTEIRLRNLMAYEECQKRSWSPTDTIISQFIILLDYLIDSDKDVAILRNSQVIISGLGSDENIATMFNRLGHGITFTSIQKFAKVQKEVRDHYNSQWKVWMSQFKQENFSNPWKFLSIVAAILILGMTAVQTKYSVK